MHRQFYLPALLASAMVKPHSLHQCGIALLHALVWLVVQAL